MAAALVVLLLFGRACLALLEPNEAKTERVEEALLEDLDEGLISEAEADAAVGGGKDSLSAELSVVQDADPRELGLHLAALYEEHPLTRVDIFLGDLGDTDVPALQMMGDVSLTAQELSQGVELFLDQRPHRASLGSSTSGPRMEFSMGHRTSGDPGLLETFEQWQELEVPWEDGRLTLTVEGRVPVADGQVLMAEEIGGEDPDGGQETVRVELRTPAGEGHQALELLEVMVAAAEASEGVEELHTFRWSGSDTPSVTVGVRDQQLLELPRDEARQLAPEDLAVFGEAEELADLVEEHIGGPARVLITDGGNIRMVERDTRPE